MPQQRSAATILGPEGPFAAKFGNYEHRTGQLAMAAGVERALAEERVLLCEAGTGTGKTLAYLVPAILSRKRVIISTATKALQEQIANQDLPLIARTLGWTPRVAVMKGLSNYLCRRRYKEFEASAEAGSPRYASALKVLGQWSGETETGDLAELAGLGESDPIWAHVASSADTRVGPGCAHFDECFVTRMRREADAAQLIVVNHHLFFADLALRGPHPASVLPDYDAVVFDEAHQIEDVAGLFFGRRISRLRTTRLISELKRATSRLAGGLAAVAEQLELRADQFWSLLLAEAAGAGPRLTLEPDFWHGPLQQAYFALDQTLEGALGVLHGLKVPGAEATSRGLPGEVVDVLLRRTGSLREAVTAIVEGSSGTVTWLELSPPALSATPVNLAPLLQERVFTDIPSVILTSATLTTTTPSSAEGKSPSEEGPFSYMRRRFGIEATFNAEEILVDSPFDFQKNALLYTPKDLPPARAPTFVQEAAARIVELVHLTQGGTLLLTTSLVSMRKLHQRLRGCVEGRLLLLQGEAPKQTLLAAFRAAGDAVLVATQSFWEGVDVPGQALRLVILEKLPFAVPTDPVIKARALAIEREGGNAFMDLFVPGAAISLKQGFGRLIRTRHDCGVVALLDERVHTKAYCRRLLRALPPVQRTNELSDVARFWSEHSAMADQSGLDPLKKPAMQPA